jgi:type I restriction enzyme S subunit
MSELRTKLPEGWAVASLGDIVDRLQYGFTTKPSRDLKAPKLLRITDIREDGVDWNTVPGCNISEDDLAKYRLIDGDMVFAR